MPLHAPEPGVPGTVLMSLLPDQCDQQQTLLTVLVKTAILVELFVVGPLGKPITVCS